MSNSSLTKARVVKNDEFYTLLADIEAELIHYKDHFRGRVVYCNCDDVHRSNFATFFRDRFEEYGLKKLIVTSYKAGALTTKIYEKTVDHTRVTIARGDGSYTSSACLLSLQEADVVVTNPPFSLFREYLATLVRYGKSFLIIGSMNAITYKQVFPLIQQNKLWLGVNNVKTFTQPDGTKKKFGNICWFTNLTHYKRNTPIDLHKQYSSAEYPMYDNYRAIEVSKVKDIPSDYFSVMGVPITFLEKYNPSQFEIIVIANNARSIGCDCRTIINGQPVYNRIIIKRKDIQDES